MQFLQSVFQLIAWLATHYVVITKCETKDVRSSAWPTWWRALFRCANSCKAFLGISLFPRPVRFPKLQLFLGMKRQKYRNNVNVIRICHRKSIYWNLIIKFFSNFKSHGTVGNQTFQLQFRLWIHVCGPSTRSYRLEDSQLLWHCYDKIHDQ